jgi:hypothetical protein
LVTVTTKPWHIGVAETPSVSGGVGGGLGGGVGGGSVVLENCLVALEPVLPYGLVQFTLQAWLPREMPDRTKEVGVSFATAGLVWFMAPSRMMEQFMVALRLSTAIKVKVMVAG